MTQAVQTVVYRFNRAHDPAWQFYSMPESTVGGGETLDEARSEYREALTFSLNTDALPTVNEYIEGEIGDLGIWLRLPIDHPNVDGVFEQMGRQIVAYPEDRDFFFANPTAGGDPVVVTASADTPLRSILDQMSVHDSLILAMLRTTPEKVQTMWLALTGGEVEHGGEEPPTSFASMGLTADSPLSDLVKAALKHHVNTVSALALC
jgi:hypothetical protein